MHVCLLGIALLAVDKHNHLTTLSKMTATKQQIRLARAAWIQYLQENKILYIITHTYICIAVKSPELSF